ncbi:hypothetical protein DFH08DRAFT_820092 [Mycena albidolilacea]|uniref:Uncharacterized protein n=1 Tax=Mycena albidolilacea TaxID=1033008 RepID=A0AAD6ZCL2_9AGAR|nr:hypothetical protein DFH08DRAFT_820092 [Mycena albidolilacea]
MGSAGGCAVRNRHWERQRAGMKTDSSISAARWSKVVSLMWALFLPTHNHPQPLLSSLQVSQLSIFKSAFQVHSIPPPPDVFSADVFSGKGRRAGTHRSGQKVPKHCGIMAVLRTCVMAWNRMVDTELWRLMEACLSTIETHPLVVDSEDTTTVEAVVVESMFHTSPRSHLRRKCHQSGGTNYWPRDCALLVIVDTEQAFQQVQHVHVAYIIWLGYAVGKVHIVVLPCTHSQNTKHW